MSCRNTQVLLSAYLDGELAGTEMMRVRDHLRSCTDCRAEYEEVRAVKRLLGVAPEVEVPVGLQDRLMQAVMADEAPARAERTIWGWALATSFAAAGIALALLQFAGRGPAPTGTEARSSTTESIAFDVSRDQSIYGSDPFGGQGPVMPASHVSGR
jgi:anti-sigma factor RsiW